MYKLICFKLVLFTCLLLTLKPLKAQVAINTDGSAPNPSAMLDLVSITKGFLTPRMTLAQRDAIASPAVGLLVYQTDSTPGFYYYNGSSWQSISSNISETDPVVRTIVGIVKSNGTTISAATKGKDYSDGTALLATGIIKTTTGTGTLSIATANDFPILNQNTTGTASNVTGVVAIANGGTNSSTALSNNRIMVSNQGKVVESVALTNGQILIGSTGTAPVAGNITTTGNAITITNSAGGINIKANETNVALTSNVTKTGTVLSNVTGLCFSIAAGETWSFEFNLQNGCSGSGGIRYAISYPTGTLRATVVGMGNATTSVSSSVITSSGALAIAVNTVTGGSNVGWTRIAGSIRATSTGTVQLQFRSGTATQTSTVYESSYLNARRH